MRDHLKFYILLHTPGYHLSLGSTFCSPSQVATDAARGKGTVFPEVALQQTGAHWSVMTLHKHQHCFSSPLLSSLPFSGLSNALVVFATRPQVIPLGTLLV